MTTFQRVSILIGVLIVIGLGAVAMSFYNRPAEERTGTEKLDAGQVIDLEVQAQQQYERENGPIN